MDDLSGQGDLVALFEARRRIVAAFEDIAAGTEALASLVAAEPIDPVEHARLREALDEERTANAQLEERVRALRDRGGEPGATGPAEAARLAEIDAVLAELIPLLEEAC